MSLAATSTTTSGRSSRTSSPSLTALAGDRGGAPARALSQPPCGAGAARAARVVTSRSCSCSTTFTGPTPPRSSWLERSCAAARRAVLSPWPYARATCPTTVRGARAGLRARQLTRIELGALNPDEAASCSATQSIAVDPDVLFDESGGNPFYLEQLARRDGWTSRLLRRHRHWRHRGSVDRRRGTSGRARAAIRVCTARAGRRGGGR